MPTAPACRSIHRAECKPQRKYKPPSTHRRRCSRRSPRFAIRRGLKCKPPASRSEIASAGRVRVPWTAGMATVSSSAGLMMSTPPLVLRSIALYHFQYRIRDDCVMRAAEACGNRLVVSKDVDAFCASDRRSSAVAIPGGVILTDAQNGHDPALAAPISWPLELQDSANVKTLGVISGRDCADQRRRVDWTKAVDGRSTRVANRAHARS
jgi:hypothetical protein